MNSREDIIKIAAQIYDTVCKRPIEDLVSETDLVQVKSQQFVLARRKKIDDYYINPLMSAEAFYSLDGHHSSDYDMFRLNKSISEIYARAAIKQAVELLQAEHDYHSSRGTRLIDDMIPLQS